MKLRHWLKKKQIRVDAFAEELGVNTFTVYRYLRGARLPSHAVMERIQQATRGKVTPNDFYEDRKPSSATTAASPSVGCGEEQRATA